MTDTSKPQPFDVAKAREWATRCLGILAGAETIALNKNWGLRITNYLGLACDEIERLQRENAELLEDPQRFTGRNTTLEDDQ